MIRPTFDEALVTQIASSLDLRAPNRDALTTIALRSAEHFATPEPAVPFEGVIDVATGVGKTYVLAAAIDYFAAEGFRNFAIVTPGRTVLRKTVANFTPGHPKGLLAGMEVEPVVITSETFSSPAAAAAIENPELVKVYIFTVQSLIRPTTTMGRRTHEFDEELGAAFYARLQTSGDLVVLADEHHLYAGPAFSRAVRGLEPQILLGLTATPLPRSSIIYRYPVAAAIADHFVKSPMIIGRQDDRSDPYTKVQDGVRLLEGKRLAIEQYRTLHPQAPETNPVMLVICASRDDADEVEAILRHHTFEGGRYAEAVLKVYSDAEDLDAQLAELDDVENPDSRVRVIVCVGMLKEGWDVRNVYVLVSLRASVSEILTEQTLGRGLRLPFGRYTSEEALDTLDVVAHERYEALIDRISRIRESFIDYRTIVQPPAPVPATAERGARGEILPAVAETEVTPTVVDAGTAGVAPGGAPAGPVITTVAGRIEHMEAAIADAPVPLYPRAGLPMIEIPVVPGQVVENAFSLNDITELEPFRAEGRRIATTPPERLRRTLVVGRILETETGEREARLERRAATMQVAAPGATLPVAVSIADVVERVTGTGIVPARRGERERLRQLVDALVEGIGADAPAILNAFPERAADGVAARIADVQRTFVPRPRFTGEVRLEPYTKVRAARPTVLDRMGPFVRGVGYTGFGKSLYEQDWFDSGSAERDLANLIDDAPRVTVWLRLQRGDLPLPWRGPNETYHPDFIVVESDGTHWVVEGKRDTDADRTDVRMKREAAERWANYVTTDTGTTWRYLFATESDIVAARGSWDALTRLGSGR